METSIQKVKKIALFTFAGIGVLAIGWVIVSSVSDGQPKLALQDGYNYWSRSGTPLGSDLSLGDAVASKETGPQSPLVGEGQLTKKKVIKTASLSLLVGKAEKVAEDMQSIAERLDGFVSESAIYEVAAGVKSGTVTVRVPAPRFNEALIEIKKLAIRVESENVNAQDVTEQFVDLEARLKNLKAEESQYLQIMKRALTVPDTLSVAERLSDVRGRIEQLEGQLQYLSRQVDMSTITASLTSEADVEVFGIRWRPLFVVKQSFRSMLGGLTGYVDAIIEFVFRLPVILLWLITVIAVAAFGWRLFRWTKKKFFTPHTQ